MTKLERLERAILIFLIALLILGVTTSAILKLHSPAKVEIGRFDAEGYKNNPGENLFEEKIDINTASAEDLMKIKGVGRILADRIVEYRYQNGRFASIDDIKSVKGMGAALFEKIKNKINAE
jgi:competence protein ComEA